MIGYLLLAFELILVNLGRTRDPRWFFGLPPLFALWVNCHGSFFLGLLVLAVFLFSSFFDLRLGLLVSSRWDLRRRRTLVWSFLLSAAALFLNPVGVKQILYPLNTLLHQRIVLSQITEWMPLRFTDPRGAALLTILGCIFLLVIVRRAELFWHELLMLIMGTVLGINHQRLAVVFGLLAAPIVSRLISTTWDSYNIKQDHPVPNAVLITLALATVIFTFPGHQQLEKQVADGNPVKAVEFIKTSHLSGHMLNAFDYGGYLIWALPGQPVFVDGRADVYEWSGVLDEFAKWATLQSGPNALLDKYDVNFCILERGSLMANVMPLLPTWKVIYSDDVSVIFVRSAK